VPPHLRLLLLAGLIGTSACGETGSGGASAAAAPPAVVVPHDSASNAISAQIEQSVWNQSPPPWTTDARWSLIRRVYDGAHYEPLWVGREGPTVAGHALIDALCAALDEGIHPAAFAADGAAWDTTTSAALAGIDLRLSAAALDVLTALDAGQIAPGAVTRNWRTPPPAARADTFLARALRVPLAASASTLRPPGRDYATLMAALRRYRRAASDGDWALPDTVGTLRPGVRDPLIPALRRRLVRSGDLPASDSAGAVYDPPMLAAVQRAQRRLGLAADGVVGPATWSALAVPAAARARAVAANLERYRWLPRRARGTTLVLDAANGSVELRAGADVLFAGRAAVTAKCVAGLPPVLADSIRAVKEARRGVVVELAGGRSLAWQPAGRTAGGDGCVRLDELDALATAMRGAAPPVLLYVIAPTAWADSDARVHFRPDTTDDDRRLETALAPVLSRPAPPACAAVSPARRPAEPPAADPGRAPRRP
jgi:murein L,D-transpeptidase YcbB/YkuD